MKKGWIWASFCVSLSIFLTACGMELPEEMDVSGHGHGTSHPGGTTSCADLKEPTTTAPVKKFHLTAKAETLKLENGKTLDAWTYNGTTPGPEIRVQQGDRVVVTLENENIQAGVTIHWHGVILPCSQDGVPGITQDAVKPGEAFTYQFIAKQAGSFWYHSHQQSSIQARKGLIGRLIVETKKKDWDYDKDYAVTLHNLDGHPLIDQKKDLYLKAEPGEKVRLRIVNARNTTQKLAVAGIPYQVISIDGNDIHGPSPVKNQLIPVGAGQRYDILFQIPENGQVKLVTLDGEEQNTSTTITLGDGREVGKITDLDRQPEFDFTRYGTPTHDGVSLPSKFDRVYTLTLDWSWPDQFTINDKVMHHNQPLMVKKGDWVKLRLVNEGGGTHPMHLHGHVFQVLTKNGKPLKSSIYMDTLPVDVNETYEIAFRADNPGLWMLHCHNLIHARLGMGMMLNYEGITTPYRVGTKPGNVPD
ncbi:multicopper oxidase family protein [Lihuaxuella thermophila]|uniref:Multicopper oxidase with three cupredoxin domains (Includes cell division protein FtsP and spore coat protein CotA) n=1 Tax=Lihuaxuella thermophila TaxID=1173111 RepID=A0A1H8ISG6_9BACL|nr:multicopper oxidase family protein [Lihuaxuella thermophila]SEN71484.1 Multicopper oxidase with three cupredoxin domains (includes cell division protein FtsP and spore coat protein CotA) [Lihuaxuella thermophila]